MEMKSIFKTGQQALDHIAFLTVAAVQLAEKWEREGRKIPSEQSAYGLALEEVMRLWDENAKKLGVKA